MTEETGPHDHEQATLHDAYIWHVNAAVSAGRDDLAWRVAQAYPDAALKLLSACR